MPAPSKLSKAHSPTNEEARKKIVEVASRLFCENGCQNTSMEMIAREAGISRKTLYRVFDRPAMVEEMLQLRAKHLGKSLRAKIRGYSAVEEALVEGVVASVAAARRDKLINEIVMQETDHRLEGFMIRGSDALRKDHVEMWSPVIEKGRKEKIVRKSLSNKRISELVMSVTSLLLMRDDFTRAEQKEFVRDLLVPAILEV